MSALGFTGAMLDRADALRNDSDAVARLMLDPRARLLRLTALDPEMSEDGRLAWGSLAEAHDGGEIIFLGFDDAKVPHFAAVNPAEKPVVGRSLAIFRILEQLPAQDAALYGGARSVVDWHMRNRFCAVCGTGTHPFRAGWGRKCPSCNAEHFPRTDPVVIMLVVHQDGATAQEDRVLLGRQRAWPPGRYSALAGFIEPGESIEEAVARETMEEAGLRVDRIRYIASQPWPFPSSLMIACIGDTDDDTLTLDARELEDAIWVSRGEVQAVLRGEPGPFVPPPPYAIAHTLLTVWAASFRRAVARPTSSPEA